MKVVKRLRKKSNVIRLQVPKEKQDLQRFYEGCALIGICANPEDADTSCETIATSARVIAEKMVQGL
ncbi:MAG: hypothetical protein AB1405_00120 [Bdellovibrionota bacterium]